MNTCVEKLQIQLWKRLWRPSAFQNIFSTTTVKEIYGQISFLGIYSIIVLLHVNHNIQFQKGCNLVFSPFKHSEWCSYRRVLFWSHLIMWHSPNHSLDHPDPHWKRLNRHGHVSCCRRILINDDVVYQCGTSSVQVIDLFSPCSPWLFPQNLKIVCTTKRWDLAWSFRLRDMVSDLVFIQYSNNCSNN